MRCVDYARNTTSRASCSAAPRFHPAGAGFARRRGDGDSHDVHRMSTWCRSRGTRSARESARAIPATAAKLDLQGYAGRRGHVRGDNAACDAAPALFRPREHRHGVPARRRAARCSPAAVRRCSRPSLTVLAFDFFFVPPRFTFAVCDVQYLVTFAVMLIVGLVIGQLTAGPALSSARRPPIARSAPACSPSSRANCPPR